MTPQQTLLTLTFRLDPRSCRRRHGLWRGSMQCCCPQLRPRPPRSLRMQACYFLFLCLFHPSLLCLLLRLFFFKKSPRVAHTRKDLKNMTRVGNVAKSASQGHTIYCPCWRVLLPCHAAGPAEPALASPASKFSKYEAAKLLYSTGSRLIQVAGYVCLL